VIFSIDSRRPAHFRHVTENPQPQLLLFRALANRDARNSFRIRSYAKCRVALTFSSQTFQRTDVLNACKSFKRNTYEPPVSIANKRPTTFAKPFRCNTYKKPGGPSPAATRTLSTRLRLFRALARIPVRMSATISCLSSQRCSFLAASATPGPTLFFSTLMGNEAKTIARGLQRRDPGLLDRLIEQYQYRLFRYLVYVTGNKERAEDFFQETWIRVLERGHQYDGKSKFEAWLFAIARHLVIDWQRSKKPQSLDTLTDPEQEHPLQLANEIEPSPLHQVLSQETEEDVQASLQKIPAIYREVLVLRFQEELQIEEMAGVLSVPLSTVKSRLYRGLEALRGALQGGAA
jgi:RNA polymerase sigma-70 factor (ECF subfamily)